MAKKDDFAKNPPLFHFSALFEITKTRMSHALIASHSALAASLIHDLHRQPQEGEGTEASTGTIGKQRHLLVKAREHTTTGEMDFIALG